MLNYDLSRAAYSGDYESVSKCLTQGADVNARSFKGLNGIQGASFNGNTRIVALLVANGADPNEGLWGAVVKNHPAVVKLLVENKASVNRRHKGDESLLTLANNLGYHEVASILTSAGGRL